MRNRLHRPALPWKAALATLYAVASSAACAFGEAPEKAIAYNNVDGDGSAGLDREIKKAYAAHYTIIDTGHASGYVEPNPTRGSLPTTATSDSGQPLSGYVLVAYIVGADGNVADPVVLKTTDARLSAIALAAMGQWRFSPGQVNGTAVATTAAQEFTFGPTDAANGFLTDHIAIYQTQDVLLRRMPGPDVLSAYIRRLSLVAHNFFVGDTTPERFDVVMAIRPGSAPRIWFVSSLRPGNAAELEPLRKLLEAVPSVEVREGPVAFAVCARVAGGAGPGPGADSAVPIPKEWRPVAGPSKEPAAISSDEFLNSLWEEKR